VRGCSETRSYIACTLYSVSQRTSFHDDDDDYDDDDDDDDYDDDDDDDGDDDALKQCWLHGRRHACQDGHAGV